MKTFNSIEKIKQAVDEGIKIFADNSNYLVIKDSKDQYLIKYLPYDSCIGLHGKEGPMDESNLNDTCFFTMTE